VVADDGFGEGGRDIHDHVTLAEHEIQTGEPVE